MIKATKLTTSVFVGLGLIIINVIIRFSYLIQRNLLLLMGMLSIIALLGYGIVWNSNINKGKNKTSFFIIIMLVEVAVLVAFMYRLA